MVRGDGDGRRCARRAAAPIASFAPVARGDATRLVLGSIPGRDSLAAGEYYAHPRNAFWPIVGALLGFDPRASYAERCRALVAARVALWDVVGRCVRASSLDSDIVDATVEVNDLAGFLAAHRRVRQVYFNGARAEQMYRRHAAAAVAARGIEVATLRLPSTSPANARLDLAAKRAAWECLRE